MSVHYTAVHMHTSNEEVVLCHPIECSHGIGIMWSGRGSWLWLYVAVSSDIKHFTLHSRLQ